MKKQILTLIFILSIGLSFSQNCQKTELSAELIQKSINDTIYKKDVYQRIEYFAVLNKDILPKYSNLKQEVLNTIENTDSKYILELKNTYDKNRLEYLNEMKSTQARVFKDVTAYSKMNTILLFETLDVFPDSYAMIFNPTIINSENKKRDKILSDRIYDKYSKKLSDTKNCFEEMKLEIKKAKSDFNIVDFNQNNGNRTSSENLKSDIIDMLIWSLK